MAEKKGQNTYEFQADKYMSAFDKLISLIESKGKITSQDIENDPLLKEALSNQTGIDAIRFLFKETNDFIMDETKKLVNDPRRKVQDIAKIALEIAEKMVNGELWSSVQNLILQSDLMRGLRHLGLA